MLCNIMQVTESFFSLFSDDLLHDTKLDDIKNHAFLSFIKHFKKNFNIIDEKFLVADEINHTSFKWNIKEITK